MAGASGTGGGENTPEQIAYELMTCIAHNERKTLRIAHGDPATADRKWILDTYAECIQTVREPHRRFSKSANAKAAVDPDQELTSP